MIRELWRSDADTVVRRWDQQRVNQRCLGCVVAVLYFFCITKLRLMRHSGIHKYIAHISSECIVVISLSIARNNTTACKMYNQQPRSARRPASDEKLVLLVTTIARIAICKGVAISRSTLLQVVLLSKFSAKLRDRSIRDTRTTAITAINVTQTAKMVTVMCAFARNHFASAFTSDLSAARLGDSDCHWYEISHPAANRQIDSA